MINFGSPRVGNEAFSTEFNKLFGQSDYRITHAHDIVPHWPKHILSHGYHHVAKEIWYKSTSDYKECDSTGEDTHCSKGVLGYSIDDHLKYLGISTDCNNADKVQLELLK